MSAPPLVESKPLEVYSARKYPVSVDDFSGKKIKQFTVVIFKSGLTMLQWKDVFKDTTRMTLLRSEMERMNLSLTATGTRTAEEQELYFNYLNETTDILIRLYDQYSVYLLSWTEAENCAFSQGAEPVLRCGTPDPGAMNPLNGGMPIAQGPLKIGRVKGEQSTSAIFPLELEHPEYGKFSIELQLKPEVNSFERFFAGNALVTANSSFVKEGVAQSHFQYGYVELRF